MLSVVRLMFTIYVAAIPLESIVWEPLGSTPQRLVGMLAGILWLFFVLVSTRGKVRWVRGEAALVAFAGWVLASVGWAGNTSAAGYALSITQLVLLTIAIADIQSRSAPFPTLFDAYWVGSLLAAMLGLGLSQGIGTSERLALSENVGPGHFAAALVPGVLFAVDALGTRRSLKSKVLMVAGLVLLGYNLLATGTRSAVLAVLAGTGVLLYHRPGRRMVALLPIAALVVMLLVNPVVYNRFVVDAWESRGTGRIDIWQVGLRIATMNPLWGVGIGSFSTSYTEDMIREAGVTSWIATAAGRDAHNIYLQVFSELGVIGLVLLGAPIAVALVGAWRRARAGDSHCTLALAILVAYLVEAFFLPMLNRKYLWFAIALALGSSSQHRRDALRQRALADPTSLPLKAAET